MSDDAPADVHLSVPQVTVCVSLVVAFLFWCCAASAYAGRDGEPIDLKGVRPRRAAISFFAQAVGRFAWHSVAQVPSAVSVMGYVLSERPGLLIGALVVEGLVIAGGMGLEFAERRLNPPRKKKRKRRKMATPE